MRRRTILWIIALAAIFGFGWRKSYENRVDLDRRAAWEERMQRLQAASDKEFERLRSWLKQLASQPDARKRAKAELDEGKPLVFERDGEREAATWTHPEYGIRLQMDFRGEKLVAHGLDGGTAQVLAIHPPPEQIATSSSAEQMRNFIVRWGPWLWFAFVLVALGSRSYGLAAAESALAAALACGTAWAVAPHYTLTLNGIFSNDKLFFAAMMYLGSLAILAVKLAPLARPGKSTRSLQFSLRTLLAVMALLAVLLAMGPFGYLAICVFAVGGLFLCFVLRLLSGRRPS
jgi:hypothetical protein